LLSNKCKKRSLSRHVLSVALMLQCCVCLSSSVVCL